MTLGCLTNYLMVDYTHQDLSVFASPTAATKPPKWFIYVPNIDRRLCSNRNQRGNDKEGVVIHRWQTKMCCEGNLHGYIVGHRANYSHSPFMVRMRTSLAESNSPYQRRTVVTPCLEKLRILRRFTTVSIA